MSEQQKTDIDAIREADVEAAARAIHAHQEYSTCWDDALAPGVRPLSEHGRDFYRALARVALDAVSRPVADVNGRLALEGRGWFVDWDSEATECGWQPCLETGQGHVPCFQVWFRTKAECEQWIAENVIGIGWYVGEPSGEPSDPRYRPAQPTPTPHAQPRDHETGASAWVTSRRCVR